MGKMPEDVAVSEDDDYARYLELAGAVGKRDVGGRSEGLKDMRFSCPWTGSGFCRGEE